LRLTYEVAADFKDILEVRGMPRPKAGYHHTPRISTEAVELSYAGLDGVMRTVRLLWSMPPVQVSDTAAAFAVLVTPQQPVALELTVECVSADRRRRSSSAEVAFAALVARDEAERQRYSTVETSDGRFNDWIARAAAA